MSKFSIHISNYRHVLWKPNWNSNEDNPSPVPQENSIDSLFHLVYNVVETLYRLQENEYNLCYIMVTSSLERCSTKSRNLYNVDQPASACNSDIGIHPFLDTVMHMKISS